MNWNLRNQHRADHQAVAYCAFKVRGAEVAVAFLDTGPQGAANLPERPNQFREETRDIS